MAQVLLRPYQAADLVDLLNLFNQTIARVNCQDYSPAQLVAWQQLQPNYQAWHARLSESFTIVAVRQQEIIGFGNYQQGEIDCLYVDYRQIGQGVGQQLLQALLVEGFKIAPVIETSASITSVSFFEHAGFQIVRLQANQRQGQTLINYRMRLERTT